MTKQVFAVFDSKANYFKNPFLMQSKGEAIRAFADLANDDKTEVGRHGEDFCLFHLGEWDEESGLYNNNLAPISLGFALEFKKSNEEIGREMLSKVLPINNK